MGRATPLWEMDEREQGWLEGLKWSLSDRISLFRAVDMCFPEESSAPWRLRRDDAMRDRQVNGLPIADREASSLDIAAVDLERMAVQLVSEVEEVSPPFTILGEESVPLSFMPELMEVAQIHEDSWNKIFAYMRQIVEQTAA